MTDAMGRVIVGVVGVLAVVGSLRSTGCRTLDAGVVRADDQEESVSGGVRSTGVPVQISTAAIVGGQLQFELSAGSTLGADTWYLVEYFDNDQDVADMVLAQATWSGNQGSFAAPQPQAGVRVTMREIGAISDEGTVTGVPVLVAPAVGTSSCPALMSAQLEAGSDGAPAFIVAEFADESTLRGLMLEAIPFLGSVKWRTIEPIAPGVEARIRIPTTKGVSRIRAQAFCYQGLNSDSYGNSIIVDVSGTQARSVKRPIPNRR